jgi:hypothetical protein
MGGRAAPWVRAQVLLLGLIAVLPVVLSLPFLGEAMDEDEGVYFSVAMFDRLPYGGVFDHKPPVVYGWYHLALLLHGGEASVATVRLLAAMNIGVAALGVVWLGSRYRDRTFGLVAGMAFSLATANQYTQPGANTEVFLLAPCVFGAACFLRGAQERRLWPMLAAGVLGGIAGMTKTYALLQPALLIAVLAWAVAMGALPRAYAVRAAVAMIAGTTVVVAAAAAPWIAAGQWHEFWYANWTYNIEYAARASFQAKIYGLADMDGRVLIGGLPLWALAGVGAVLAWRRSLSLEAATITACAAAAWIGASATGREYPHYWIPLVPFAAVFAAEAALALTSNWRSAPHRFHAEALVAALTILALIVVAPLYVLPADSAHGLKYPSTGERATHAREIAAMVRAHSGDGDTMFVFGYDSQVYVLADRAPATYFTRPLLSARVDAETWRRTLAELEAAPLAVVVDVPDASESDAPGLPDYVRPQFEAFLHGRYHAVGSVAHAVVYVRS